MIIVIDVAPFVEPARFVEEVEALCTRVATSPPAEGCEAVLLPGDRALKTKQERTRSGIPIPDLTWTQLEGLAAELGVVMTAPR